MTDSQYRTCKPTALDLLALAVWAQLCCPLWAIGEQGVAVGASQQTGIEKRTLHFPEGKSLGTISVGSETDMLGDLKALKPVAGAAGAVTVAVPSTKRILFEANRRVFEDPSCLDKVSPKGLDSVSLTFISLDDREDHMCEAALSHMSHFQGLKYVNLCRADITDRAAAQLKNIPSLEGLDFQLTPIKGSCLEELAALVKLKRLIVADCSLDEKNLRFLPRFKSLQNLDLSRIHMTQAGAEVVGKCDQLKALSVAGNNKFDDNCLLTIAKLKNLESLKLYGTAVTLAGIKAVKFDQLKEVSLPQLLRKNQDEVLRHFPHAHIIEPPAMTRAEQRESLQIFAPLRP